MNVLIRNGGFVNKGAEAMTRTVQRELAARISGATFAFAEEAVTPYTETLIADAGLRVLSNDWGRVDKLQLLSRQIFTSPCRAFQNARDPRGLVYDLQLRSVQAIVDISGFAYGDTWKPFSAQRTLQFIEAAKERKIPYIFMPQAWGPFDKAAHRIHYRRICEGATKFYSRDNLSSSYLASLLDTFPDRIESGPDIAFRFLGDVAEHGREILDQLGLPRSSSAIVGVAPNQRVYERAAGIGFDNAYITLLCQLCRHIRQSGFSVVLLPHEIRPNNTRVMDDRILCSMVAGFMRDERVVAMTGQYTAEQIKGVIANLDILVGSRFHALVAALSQGIPTLALGWSHKYMELLTLFALDRFVVCHDSFDYTEVVSLLDELIETRRDHRANIVSRLTPILKHVDNTFDTVAEVLCAASGGIRSPANSTKYASQLERQSM